MILNADFLTFLSNLGVEGLWLHESGVLAASPDGLVVCPPASSRGLCSTTNPQLVEVKCPFSARDMKVVDAAQTIKDFFLSKCCGRTCNIFQSIKFT